MMRHSHHNDGKGNKCQQGNVVRDQHRSEETETHEQDGDQPQICCFFTQHMRQMGKEACLAKPIHHCHQAVQQRERTEIEIRKIHHVRGHEKAGEQSRKGSNKQDRFAADKGTDSGHTYSSPENQR